MEKTKHRAPASMTAWLLVLSLLLSVVVLVALPQPVVALDAEDDPVLGYGFADSGYVSNWAGQSIRSQSWGAWVNNDGMFNSAFAWHNCYDNLLLVDGKIPADGTVTFVEPTSTSLIKFHPGQTTTPLKVGPAYISFEIYYDSGTYTKNGEEVTNFAGVSFGNPRNGIIFCVDNTDGKIYYGNLLAYAKQDPDNYYLGQFKDGWNTVEMVFLPKDTSGNVVTSIAEEQTAADVIATNTVYIRSYHESAPAGETYGFTDAEFAANFKSFDYSQKDFYSNLGSNMWLNPIKTGAGNLTFGSAKAFNLIPDTPLYEITYEGYSHLMQHVKADSSNNKVFAVPATLSGSTDPVVFWKSVDANGDMSFYAPTVASRPNETSNADLRMNVTRNMVLSAAVGADLLVAQLGATMDKISPDFSVYTYVQLLAYIDELNEVATASGLPSDNNYIVKKEQLVEEMQTECDFRATSTEELILLAEIFSDESAVLEDRIDAYYEATEIFFACDATYFNGNTGVTAEISAQAVYDYAYFQTSWENTETAWNNYQLWYEMLLIAEPGRDANELYQNILQNFSIIRSFFPNYTLDSSIETGYISNMTALLTEFRQEKNLADMYAFLAEWITSWNTCRKIIYGSYSKITPPEALATAVQEYNAAVYAFNSAAYNAALTAGSIQDTSADSEDASRALSDIKNKINSAYNGINGAN